MSSFAALQSSQFHSTAQITNQQLGHLDHGNSVLQENSISQHSFAIFRRLNTKRYVLNVTNSGGSNVQANTSSTLLSV